MEYDITIKQEDGSLKEIPIHVDAVTSPTDKDAVKKVGQVRENNGALEYALDSAPTEWKAIGGGGGAIKTKTWTINNVDFTPASQQSPVVISTDMADVELVKKALFLSVSVFDPRQGDKTFSGIVPRVLGGDNELSMCALYDLGDIVPRYIANVQIKYGTTFRINFVLNTAGYYGAGNNITVTAYYME